MFNSFSRQRKLYFLIIDIAVIILAAYFSFLIRFEGQIPVEQLHNLKGLVILSLVISLPIFYWRKLYRFNWIYVGLNDLYRMITAITLASLLTTSLIFILRDTSIFIGFPRSIIFINYFLTLLSIGGLRIGKRMTIEMTRQQKKSGRKVLIIGAGGAGEELSRSITKFSNHNLIGFVDDDKNKQRTTLHGYPVLGTRQDIQEIVKKFGVEEIIIAFPSVDQQIIKETTQLCRQAKIEKIKILPSTEEILNEKISLNNVRDISIEDLLGRSPIQIDTQIIKNFITNKKILVTGAAGSIGSQLCKEILKFKPAQLITLDQNETGIFYLKNELDKNFPQAVKKNEIGDICDEKKVNWLFSVHRPEIVFHAAAYKHVPLMEEHPIEATKNNIFGTLNIAEASIKYGVKKFVFISTDKAVNPTSVMGATKQAGEMICLWLNKSQITNFCAVRFGNVLDSQGNVIGLFEKQIKKGGPVEITHPEMKRYFMITAEACLLVMQAGALSKGGEVFVLDMGEPIKIIDLAKEMIKLAGYQPDIDIPIVFTQPRPGEKLFEEILTKNEQPTKYEKIYMAHLEESDEKKMLDGLDKLKTALAQIKKDDIIKTLKELIPSYQSQKYDGK